MRRIILAILFFLPVFIQAQSISGNPGLLNIPTAETIADGDIVFGVSYTNKKYVNDLNNKYDAAHYFVSVGFLPFLEVSMGITRYINLPYGQALGDRVPGVRVRLLEEKNIMPALVIGAHDFMETKDEGTNKLSNALYIVTSKHFEVNSNIAGAHLGYGTNWIKSFENHFLGFFGGISFEHKKTIRAMIEYDAEKLNCGTEIILFKHFKLLAGLMNFNTFSGGISYKARLF